MLTIAGLSLKAQRLGEILHGVEDGRPKTGHYLKCAYIKSAYSGVYVTS
ncbi:protein of unknown function [uncultured Woeseiaceae bacterium]|uniref:Uncharacterized protein n=1 Tax=uncultured Woeseiaceae bacterium TaxID=1983305 RepID=A0A7D9D192_9GAMM|nr:protein of unknown function [uncultured Woeseiaceae bacterium]